MPGFYLALAPFALFAFFPSKLNVLGKAGGWLNAVKVTLGFLELAHAKMTIQQHRKISRSRSRQPRARSAFERKPCLARLTQLLTHTLFKAVIPIPMCAHQREEGADAFERGARHARKGVKRKTQRRDREE